METGILIAVISAVGVIGTAVVQWRSNVKTLNYTSATMRLESDQRTAQAMREAEERSTIRQEERETADARFKLESQTRWLETRQELHEATLANLPQLMTHARLSVSGVEGIRLFGMTRGDDLGIFGTNLVGFVNTYATLSDELLDRESKMDLYGSEDSSSAYSAVLLALGRLEFEIKMMLHPSSPDEVERISDSKAQSISKGVKKLTLAYEKYVAAARADLRTNQ